jgi:hypothetical protein
LERAGDETLLVYLDFFNGSPGIPEYSGSLGEEIIPIVDEEMK